MYDGKNLIQLQLRYVLREPYVSEVEVSDSAMSHLKKGQRRI